MLKPKDVVKFKDDENEEPFLVHGVIKKYKLVSLGLRTNPKIENTCFVSWSDVTKLKGKELKEGIKTILKLMR